MAALIDKHFRLPTIPVTASRALTAIADPRTTIQALSDIISQDQGLTTRILSVANSVAYSPSTEIKNIHQAAAMLGFKTMENLVVAASYRAVYKRFGEVEKRMWEHSVACGLAAQQIAEERSLACTDEAFVAGLMHDVGRVIMNNGERDKLATSATMAADLGIDTVTAEQRVFGFSHCDVGALLLSRWSLSESLHDATLLHHDPEEAEILSPDHVELCRVVYAANLLVHAYGIGSDLRTIENVEDDPTLIALELSTEALERIAERVKGRFDAQHR